MPSIAERYEKTPNFWNVSIVITLGTLLWGAMVWNVNFQIENHRRDIDAHPVIVSEMRDNTGKLIRQEIYFLDERLCGDPHNKAYIDRLIVLFEEYREKTGKEFSRELLKCAGKNNGRNQ